jgi:predicted alpha/beta hydrolase family esterase
LKAIVFFAGTYFVDLSKKPFRKAKNKSDPLIICLMGYLHNSSGAYKIKSLIENKTGYEVKCLNPKSYFDSIDQHTKNLNDEIKKILQGTDVKKIILIGHSMGGLVALNYALQNQEKKSLIKDVITIASPFQGTKIAHMGFGKCAKDMYPDSLCLQSINESAKNNPNFRILQIGLKHDLIVPYQSAFLQDISIENTRTIENVGHVEVLMSEEMINALIDYIKSHYSK